MKPDYGLIYTSQNYWLKIKYVKNIIMKQLILTTKKASINNYQLKPKI